MLFLINNPLIFIIVLAIIGFVIFIGYKIYSEISLNKLLKQKQLVMRVDTSSFAKSFNKRIGLLTSTALAPIAVVLIVVLSQNNIISPAGDILDVHDGQEVIDIYNDFQSKMSTYNIFRGFTSEENVDFAPTILDFANAQIPKVMQGSSFKSILEYGKEPENWKTAAYYHYYLQLEHHLVPAHIGIRTKEYKLLMFYGTDRKSNTPTTPPGWELYDLKNDPTEDFNVYKDLKYAEVVKDLKIKLRALRAKYKEDGKEFAFNQVIEKYWDYTKQDYERAKEISAKAPAYMDSLKQSKLAKNRKRKKGSAKELDDKHN